MDRWASEEICTIKSEFRIMMMMMMTMYTGAQTPSRPHLLCLFFGVVWRLFSSGVLSHDSYRNFCSVCAVAILSFSDTLIVFFTLQNTRKSSNLLLKHCRHGIGRTHMIVVRPASFDRHVVSCWHTNSEAERTDCGLWKTFYVLNSIHHVPGTQNKKA